MIQRGKFLFISDKDNKMKIVNERISDTEKRLVEFSTIFSEYCRKLRRFRDKNDDLAKFLENCSHDETVSKTLSSGLDNLSRYITFLADNADLEVSRIETKILSVFPPYELIFKTMREKLRAAVIKRDKELIRRKQLIDLRNKFSSNSRAADSDIMEAKLAVSKSNKEIDQMIETFEMKKIQDVKTLLLDFIQIRLKEVCKSMEILTAAYHDVAAIDEKADCQSLKKFLKFKTISQSAKRRFRSMDSIQSDQGVDLKKRYNMLSKSVRNLSEKSLNEEEEDEKDDSDISEEGVTESDAAEGSQTNTDEDSSVIPPKSNLTQQNKYRR